MGTSNWVRWAARGGVAAAGTAATGAGVLGAILAGQVHVIRGRPFLTETRYERHLRFPGPPTGDPGGVPPLRVAVMGDSTTTGVGTRRVGQTYAAALGRRLARRGPVEVFITGRAGARARDVLRDQLPRTLAARPHLVLCLVGANDVTHLTPTPAFRRTVNQILDALTGVPTVIAGVPELGSVPAIPPPLRDLAAWRGHLFTGVIRAAARGRARVRFVNLAGLTGPVFGANPAKAFASDLFHPSPHGYAFWAAALAPAVEASDPRRGAPARDGTDLPLPDFDRALLPGAQTPGAGPPSEDPASEDPRSGVTAPPVTRPAAALRRRLGSLRAPRIPRSLPDAAS